MTILCASLFHESWSDDYEI